ncbi:pantothenate kinase [Bowmanella denitrificans]|uniref:Type III pantothenate kinase n=1 Tax=Bowmanella denitrificans TaxID=366582 RepID=A0ABN0XSU8_9ALTE
MSEVHSSKWLYIDVGNSRTKVAASDGTVVRVLGCIDTPEELTPWLEGVEAVLVASVGHDDWLSGLQRLMGRLAIPLFHAEVQESFGSIKNCYDNPLQMGVDRWLAVIGAAQLTDTAFVVLDFGTAINVEFVDSQHHYLGGWITPGISLMYKALFGGTSKVRGNISEHAGLAPGTTTQKAVDAGCLAAALGVLEQASVQGSKMAVNPTIFVCGGDYPRIQSLVRTKVQHEPDLVFLGMQKYLEQIRGQTD